jgi:chemotaxis signal transduction protein
VTMMVCFRAEGAAYCLPVGAARAVRTATGLVALPAPGADVIGIMPGDPPLTVLGPLGRGGAQILVLESDERTFGLLVDAVTGLQRIADGDIHAAPGGQDRPLVCGTVDSHGDLLLLTDAAALAARL